MLTIDCNCMMGNQGKMAGNSKVCMEIQKVCMEIQSYIIQPFNFPPSCPDYPSCSYNREGVYVHAIWLLFELVQLNYGPSKQTTKLCLPASIDPLIQTITMNHFTAVLTSVHIFLLLADGTEQT